ncbi:secretory phospholipase A2 receptor-like isoform X2 [Periplaneta americana]|uniref:secretory phospholipase A2 receptor-like isoform X2 n=1 Tax=Periplaneta americana TaxID=6978 RepID=UPI0037E9612F
MSYREPCEVVKMWHFVVFSLAVMGIGAELVPGLGYYWVPRDLNGTVNAEFRFDEAMIRCHMEGGHLVIINSAAEAKVVSDLIAKYSTKPQVYVGFTALLEEGFYITINDHPLERTGYTKWAEGYPTDITSNRCGAANANGELVDVDCYTILNLVCEKELWQEYDLLPGFGYYSLHLEDATWGEALEQCHLEGSTLAVPNSDEEAAAIAGLFKDTTTTLAHVGLHDRYREAFYMTVQGVKIDESGYNKWVANQPIKRYDINFVGIDNEGLYNMVNNTERLPFICEHPL